MPGFDLDDFSKPLVEGLAMYDGKWVGLPFDIPIFITMYRKDILEKHGIKPPTTMDEFTAAVKQITEAEKANGIFGTGLQAKSGHYSLNCDWTQVVWNEGGSIFGADKKFKGNDEAGVRGPAGLSGMAQERPAAIHRLDLGRPGLDDGCRPGCARHQWAEYMPGMDAEGSKVAGLWEPMRPITGKALRPVAEAGFGEIPHNGHQGGSILGLSKYSKNVDAAWLFMQWPARRTS